MIQHSVIFKLKYPNDSAEEHSFLQAAGKLSAIPGVVNFQSLRQISKKNNFDYGLSMQFENMQAYEAYNKHADHTAFIETYWIQYVEDFMEIDYEPIV